MGHAAQPSGELPTPPKDLSDGRDELNLAEFALSVPWGESVKVNNRTRKVEDTIVHKGRTIRRTFMVTSGEGYPPPNCVDDQVIQGLIQLGHLNGWQSRKLFFTRAQLLSILGWGKGGAEYQRLAESLEKIATITFTFRNAWWNPVTGEYDTAVFGLYHDLRIAKKEFESPQPETTDAQTALQFSTSVLEWDQIPFQSFTGGGLKQLNYDFLGELKKKVAKRIYRFLDKAFMRSSSVSFDLEQFAAVHIGFSPGQGVAEYRRKLQPGIKELEDKGFIQRKPISERIQKIRPREYEISFERGPLDLKPQPLLKKHVKEGKLPRMARQLMKRGITESEAVKISSDVRFPEAYLQRQLAWFDWRVEQGWSFKGSRQGWLVTAIREHWEPPDEFFRYQKKAKQKAEQQEAQREREEAEKAEREKETALLEEWRKEYAAFWGKMTEEERQKAEQAGFELLTPEEKDCDAPVLQMKAARYKYYVQQTGNESPC